MFVARHCAWSVVVAIAVCAAGCASRSEPVRPQAAAAPPVADHKAGRTLRIDTQLVAELPRLASEPLFSSGLSLGGLGETLAYSAAYRVQTDATTPQALGSQQLQQRFSLRLPAPYGAPLQFDARAEQQAVLLSAAAAPRAQQSMQLQWAPSFAALQLTWTPEGAAADPAQALRCDVAGQLSVPLRNGGTSRFATLDAGTRACAVLGPDAPAASSAQIWSAGLRWGAARRETSVRVLGVAPDFAVPDAGKTGIPLATAGESPDAYEVRLAQQRALGAWQARADLAWRRPPDGQDAVLRTASSPWAASAELSRQLAMTKLSASWQRGDPYWFLTGVRESADRLALSVDLSPWAAMLGRMPAPALAMSYQWLRLDDGEHLQAEQSLHWNLSFPWR